MQRNGERKSARDAGNDLLRYSPGQRQNGENTGCYRNRHATGAGKSGSSQVAEVRTGNKAASVDYSNLNDSTDTIDLPTPPPTPNKTRNSAFPLFNSLLNEGRHRTTSDTLTVPATAPILVNTTSSDARSRLTIHSPRKHGETGGKANVVLNLEFDDTLDEMEIEKKKAMITKVVEHVMRKDRKSPMSDDSMQPLTLQDPPKSKLKRQLSIGTVDTYETGRIRKRAYTRGAVNDENHKQSWTPYVDADEVDGTPPFQAYTSDMTESVRGRYPYHGASASHIGASYSTGTGENSPALFDMRDIGLTSPFVNTTPTPRKPGRREENVFVFPETSSQKISPAKPNVLSHQYPAISRSNTDSVYDMDEPLNLATRPGESDKHKFNNSRASTTVTSTSSYRSYPIDPQSRSTGYSSRNYEAENVTNKEFVWPASAAVTQATSFSPRVASTETKPKFPGSKSPSKGTSVCNSVLSDDAARLVMLEREYARARQVYGRHATSNESREMSPRSHEITARKNTLRSISDVERSPNDKDIRGMSDDVRTKYERSVSDPRCSPRQVWSKLNQPSPARARASETASPDARDAQDRQRYLLQSAPDSPQEVRRRLFTREDCSRASGRDTETIDLPEEIASFFRDRNIQPEDIDHLKGIIERSSTSGNTGTYDDRKYDTFEAELRGGRSYSSRTSRGAAGLPDDVFLSPTYRDSATGSHDGRRRIRNKGDIDVRLQCESVVESTSNITEKISRVKEILTDLDHEDQNCKCARIEEEIFQMAHDAYRKIHRAKSTPESLGQFHTELDETDRHIYKSLRLLAGIKCLCKYGRSLEDVFTGSVVFRVNCPTVTSLEELWRAYTGGDIVRELTDVYVTDELKERFGVSEVTLKVVVNKEEYEQCKAELETAAAQSDRPTTPEDAVTIVHIRSRSEPIASPSRHVPQFGIPKTLLSPFRERFISDTTIEVSPRKVFQEINGGKYTIQSSSPNRKSYLDNVFLTEGYSKSGRLTPKRKSAGVKAVREHENIHPGETFPTL